MAGIFNLGRCRQVECLTSFVCLSGTPEQNIQALSPVYLHLIHSARISNVCRGCSWEPQIALEIVCL